MPIDRRDLLRLVSAGIAAAALDVGVLGGLSGSAAASAARTSPLDRPGRGLFGGLTTLDRTVARSTTANAKGYRKIIDTGPGEAHGYAAIDASFRNPLVSLDAFVQMTDLQIVDDKSPARVEWVDRLAGTSNGPNQPIYDTGSAYRPQEVLSTQIVEAMVRAIRNVLSGPVTGLPLSFTILTGDMVDNVQYNETRWYINLLDGGLTIRADSGQYGLEQSVTGLFGDNSLLSGARHDVHYWYPEAGVAPDAGISDDYQAHSGFPVVPGLLAAARRPYMSTGLGMPWYAAMGNHDAEVQGNYPVHPNSLEHLDFPGERGLPDISDHPTAARKGIDSATVLDAAVSQNNIADFIDGMFYAPVVADQDRRFLTAQEFAAEHFTTAGSPVGHGFGRSHTTFGDVYTTIYSRPSSRTDLIEYMTLDTVNYEAGANGHVHESQYHWLEETLLANSSRFYRDDGTLLTNPSVVDKLFVIFCHHTIATMNNGLAESTVDGEFFHSADIEKLLLRYPNVILLVNGHTHRNTVEMHRRGVTTSHGIQVPGTGGFWEVSTASHIDWPAQSRVFEIAAGDGAVSIFATLVDIDGPADYNGDLSSPTSLASLARELAANDPQEQTTHREGQSGDRNMVLQVPEPFPITVPVDRGSSVAVGRWADDHMSILGTKSDDSIWLRSETPPRSDNWSDWQQLPGGLRSVACATNAYGGVELYGVSPSGAVWRQYYNGSSWSGWQLMANIEGTAMAVAANADGRLEMYVTRTDGTIYQRFQRLPLPATPGGEIWSDWTSWSTGAAAGLLFAKVAAATNLDGRLELFAVERNGTVNRRRQSGPNIGWEDWIDFGLRITGPPLTGVTALTVTRFNDGRLALYAIDYTRQVFSVVQSSAGSDTWGAWTGLNAGNDTTARMTELSAQRDGNGLVDVYGVDHVGDMYRCRQTAVNSATYTAWTRFTGSLRSGVPKQAGTVVPVPGLTGLQQADAAHWLLSIDLGLGAVTTTRSAAPAGTVVGQSPAAGQTLALGSSNPRVNLVLSDGSVPVPDISGLSISSAQRVLGNAGLNLGNETTHDTTNCDIINQISGQNPAAGTLVSLGSSVNFDMWVLRKGSVCQ